MEIESERQLAIIASEIQQMAREDQEARTAGIPEKTGEVDDHNKVKLEEIIDRIGWPTKSKVGAEAAHDAWLLVQHADQDPAFQRRCLKLMSDEKEGEIEKEDIAYLDDRIRVGEGQPQLYGTQWRVDEDKGYIPEDIQDPDNLDKRRAEMGMEAFSEWSEAMQKWYQEWSKENKIN
tara:strand:- start:84 stop:614 length:531 start_codon:yes stop_codon:yes gene_type:complete